MPRPLTGQLEKPDPKQGRPNYSYRIRVNGRQRRFDLGTADPVKASQERDIVLADIKADLAAKKDQTRSRALLSVAHVRKLVAVAGKTTRTFPAVAERYWQQQEANGVKTWKEQRSVLQRYVLPAWPSDVSKYTAQMVRDLLAGLDGLAHATRLHVLSALSGVFDSAVLSGLIAANPCKQVQRRKLLPKRRDEDAPKLRATLLPGEVETMCAWVHPEEQHRPATERLQGKLRLAYALGLRHYEIAALRWDDFGADFERVTVYRAKKRDPAARRDALDLTELPELRDWLDGLWKAAGKPSTGLLFPAVRDGKTATAGKDQAKGLSEADALRRLYKRAHGIEAQVTRSREMVDKRVKAGKRTVPVKAWEHVRELTERERLVLDGSERVSPVCFHASRHAWAQAADAGGLTVEQAREVLDHENERQTKGYQRSLGVRAKLVPNVHKLAAMLANRPASAAADTIECDQSGRIENCEPQKLAHPVGFEPTTLGFEVRCSIQLS
jgi:integrase